jgi:hypothetical protein
VAWVGPRSEVPLTRTGPHSRTHTMPIKHAVPPLIHAHNVRGAHTRHVHATCTPARSAHAAPIRITDYTDTQRHQQGERSRKYCRKVSLAGSASRKHVLSFLVPNIAETVPE